MKTILFALTLALFLSGCRVPEQYEETQDVHIEVIAWNR